MHAVAHAAIEGTVRQDVVDLVGVAFAQMALDAVNLENGGGCGANRNMDLVCEVGCGRAGGASVWTSMRPSAASLANIALGKTGSAKP